MRKYRKAIPEDDLEIAKVSVASWKYAYKGIIADKQLESLDPKKRAKGRSNFLRENSLSTFVCAESGKLIGFVDFDKCRDDDCDEKTGEVWAIYVLPEYIGKSIGKELFLMSLEALLNAGYKEVTVWVLAGNKLARDFYERQGFALDGNEKMYQGLLEVRYRRYDRIKINQKNGR